MRTLLRRLAATGLALALLAGACVPSAPAEPTVDVNAIYTIAAQTLAVQLTALVPTATFTPAFPTATVTPIVIASPTPRPTDTPAVCDNADVLADVNVPDNSIMAPDQDFIKTWRIRNTGTCPWGQGYAVTYGGYADRMNGQPLPLTVVVNPGDSVEVSVQFRAPKAPGQYLSAWRMINPNGVPFGKFFYVQIIVRP